MQTLAGYSWPGNVRELRNVIEFAAATVQESAVEPWHLPEKITGSVDDAGTEPASAPPAARSFRPVTEEMRELERTRMVQALDAADGVQRRAAELIGMPLRTFVMKIKQYGISPRARRDT
jgi:DNA-binding NtrC family response regulator